MIVTMGTMTLYYRSIKALANHRPRHWQPYNDYMY